MSLDLSNRNLTEFPDNLPNSIIHLYLSNNKIEYSLNKYKKYYLPEKIKFFNTEQEIEIYIKNEINNFSLIDKFYKYIKTFFNSQNLFN